MTDRPAPPRHRAPGLLWYFRRRLAWRVSHPFAPAPWEVS